MAHVFCLWVSPCRMLAHALVPTPFRGQTDRSSWVETSTELRRSTGKD